MAALIPLELPKMDIHEFSDVLQRSPAAPLLEHHEAFRDFCNELDASALISSEIRMWLSEPRRAARVVSEHTIRLKRIGRYVLDLTVLHQARIPATLCTHQDILQRFCGSGGYERFKIVHEDGLPAGLENNSAGSLSDGDVFGIDGSREVFVAHAFEPIRFISLCEFESTGIRYKFDSATLRPVGAFAASPLSTAIQLATRFLGYYGEAACVPALRHVLGHPISVLQWEAACALARVDRDEGLQAMRRLKLSTHPEVARAASEAAQQLSA
jgi:hypothetical protein